MKQKLETKKEKFRRIAEGRANKAILAIRSLGNLSNPSHYDYSGEDVGKIFGALKKEIEETRILFQKSKGSEKPFKL